jgi:hypothetical protein
VRIAGPDGREVPYLVREVPVPTPPLVHAVVVVDPVTLPDGSSRAVLDLGKVGLKHGEVSLSIDGSDFFRRTRIEVSNDEKEWAKLAEGAIVFRALTARYPSSHKARYHVPASRPLVRSQPPRR